MTRRMGALAVTGLACILAGCSAVLGIDGSYGDQSTTTGDAGPGVTGDAGSPPTSEGSAGPGVTPEAGSLEATPGDEASGPSPDSGGPPRDAGVEGAAPAEAGPPVSEAGSDTGTDAGTVTLVTASNRRLAFGPSADGKGTPSVFALRDDGTVLTWSFGASMSAAPASGVPASTTLAGGTHVCSVAASDHSLWCWGPGSPSPAGATPTQLPGTGTGQWTMSGVTNGDQFTCILDTKGTVGCAGTLAGWTSPGNALSYPVFTGGMFASGQLFDAADISAAGGAMCVVNQSPQSGLYCWGNNADLVAAPTGQTSATQAYPWVVLSSPNDPGTVSVSPSHACTVYLMGGAGASHVVCWGAVPESDGGAPEAWDPLTSTGAASVVTTGVAGTEATFLVMPDGTVRASGSWPSSTQAGLLGASYPSGSAAFVKVSELSGVVELAAYGTEVCARLADGGIECWGSGGSGTPVAPTRVGGLP